MVRSPINDQFRATGRSTMGVKFVTPKGGDTVAVVARSVEKDAAVEEAVEEAIAEARRDARELDAMSAAAAVDDEHRGQCRGLGRATIDPDTDTEDEPGDEG